MSKILQLELFKPLELEIIRCKICNRKLKNIKARKQGYGHHCYKLYLTGYRGIQSTIDDFIKETK
jgi:hypothetical protein